MAAPLETADPILARQARHGHWLLRAPLAAVLLYHGLEKLLGPGVAGFAADMNLPVAIAIAVVLCEIGAGFALIAGNWLGDGITRLGAALACPVLLGAIFTVHWGQWHFLPTASHPMGGLEFQVTLMGLALYLLIRGNQT